MQAICGRREFSGGLSLWVAAVPKRDRSPGENEDAAAWCLSARRFAIADGATDSAYAGIWATSLAREFVASGLRPGCSSLADTLPGWLAPLQANWRESIPWYRLPWYLEEKARLGAFTTLLGLELDPNPTAPGEGKEGAALEAGTAAWHAVAIGDSCLFHWRRDLLLAAFPLVESAAFGTRPYLVGSLPGCNGELRSYCRQTTGCCRPGDHFLLATDAIAQWLLRESENGRWRAGDLLAAEDETSFENLVQGLRDSQGLRDDDTTLVHIRVGHDFVGPGGLEALPVPEPSDPLVAPPTP